MDPDIEEVEKLAPLLRAMDPSLMVAEPVSTYVNQARNEGPQCIECSANISEDSDRDSAAAVQR